ncbi:glycine cleavage system protein GcvH [Tepidiphilus olei]|uniref:glycine cleavage system protein GcvH n=1 Tax=Tepidiphilus olei TaxID=2502184 RepID=UPI00115C471F|nr:glycine cleavage system protein GcvH [Tepidiphilus olei]
MNPSPDDRLYLPSHQWLRREDDGIYTLGITDHAQRELGDIVYVQLPEPGQHLEAGDVLAVVESVKVASEILCPFPATVVAVNEEPRERPERLNEAPYEVWLLQLMPDEDAPLPELLTARAYDALLSGRR